MAAEHDDKSDAGEVNRLRLWQRIAIDCIHEIRQAYAPGEVGDSDAPAAIRRLVARLNAQAPASAVVAHERPRTFEEIVNDDEAAIKHSLMDFREEIRALLTRSATKDKT